MALRTPPITTDPLILGDGVSIPGTVLELVGGVDRSNGSSPVTNPNRQLDADVFNRDAQAVSDLYLRLQSRVDVRDFLTTGDGTADDTLKIEAAYAMAKSRGKHLHFGGPARYKITRGLIFDTPNSGFRITADPGAVIVYPSADETLNGTYPLTVTASIYGVSVGGTYDGVGAHRAAIYIRNAVDVTISGTSCEGNYAEVDINKNFGPGIYLYKCSRTRVENIRQKYGGSMCSQTHFTEDYGTTVDGFYQYGCRNAGRLGDDSEYLNGTFETPILDSSYDRVGNNGSSSGVYIFANAGSYSSVKNCRFIGTRVDAIKISGSSAPLHSFSIWNCDFRRVGVKTDGSSNGGACILFGADDVGDLNEHSSLSIGNINAVDCNTVINVYGSRSVHIDGVTAHWNVAPAAPSTGHIGISRYPNPFTRPVEAVTIRNVKLSAEKTIGGTNIAAAAIKLQDVGDVDSADCSSINLQNIDIEWCAGTGIVTTRCVAPTFTDITCTGINIAMNLGGDVRPFVDNLKVVAQTSNNAQIQRTDVTWLTVGDVYTAGQLLTGASKKAFIGDNNGGTSGVQDPLLGKTGASVPTASHHEVVLGFGTDWTPAGTTALGRASNDPADTNGTATLTVATDTAKFRKGQRCFVSPNSNASSPRTGTLTVASKTSTTVTFTGTVTGFTTSDYIFQAADTVDLNNVIFTYVSSGANSTTTFTTMAQLIACIVATTFWTAADYGAAFAANPTTRHIRIRLVSTGGASFYLRTFCYRPTCGVILPNASATTDRMISRGGSADQFVIYSPRYRLSSPPVITPLNAAASTLMSGLTKYHTDVLAAHAAADATGTLANYKSTLATALTAITLPAPVPIRVVVDAHDPEATCVMTCTSMVGTEEFAWRVS